MGGSLARRLCSTSALARPSPVVVNISATASSGAAAASSSDPPCAALRSWLDMSSDGGAAGVLARPVPAAFAVPRQSHPGLPCSRSEKFKREQKELEVARKRLAADLRNQERRRARLKRRARQLSDGDLLAVLQMRQVESGGAASAAAPAAELPAAAPAASHL